MMSAPIEDPLVLPLASPVATFERVGGKGASLAHMASAGFTVPAGFHITTLAYRRFVCENQLSEAILDAATHAAVDDPEALELASVKIHLLFVGGTIADDIASSISQHYLNLGGDNPAVAVRSSATAEDLPEMSFAGQHETYLNIRGTENVLDAVKRCWASLWTARAIAYRARQGVRADEVALAVCVQQLIDADVAGILFTANPVTGSRDQLMINAAWGLGEAIVGGLVAPDTLTVTKETGAIETQSIANKDVMTVRSPSGTREEPVPAEKRTMASLTSSQATELARTGIRIEQLYGRPMDIEWALCDGHVFLLQARPITALPEPPACLEWTLPVPKGRYARSSVIELLPDPLSPLFETMALPLWNSAMHRLVRELGLTRAMPDHSLVTINNYAYYDLSTFSALRAILAMPRVFWRAVGWMRRAQTRWAEESRPRYVAGIQEWKNRDLSIIQATQLLEGARATVRLAADHYLTIQSGILPVAYMSETLLALFYRKIIKRETDPPALTYLLGFDSSPILAEKSLYDLAAWARSQSDLLVYLSQTPSATIAPLLIAPSSPIADSKLWSDFCRRFSDHLDCFGHAVYDLDFAKGLAADEPAPVLGALKFFLTGEARSPYERQSAAAEAREQATGAQLDRLRWVRLRWFTGLLRWAQRYAPLREDALADVGLGWPLLRRMLREVGRRLAAAGAIANQDDVFWLKHEELEAEARALDAGQASCDSRHVISERRATWDRERRVTPPVVLPIKGGARMLGIDFSRWMPARTDQATGNTIRGIGSSPGCVAGEARVIHGPDEFDQMRRGEILVAKITTPAWTPLFALATGIVTDVGGPLSHSSIVAREYQIPAVLGTGVATERIQSGQRITVDGDGGIVTIGTG
jgi:rifampicin phosphotransferase